MAMAIELCGASRAITDEGRADTTPNRASIKWIPYFSQERTIGPAQQLQTPILGYVARSSSSSRAYLMPEQDMSLPASR